VENARLKNVMEKMRAVHMEQMIVTSSASIFYLLGKWINPGERMLALLLKTSGEQKLIINELFPITEDLGVEICVYNDADDPVQLLADLVESNKLLGVDKGWAAHFLLRLMELCPGMEYKNGSLLLDQLRMIKDAEEIERLRAASQANDQVMKELVSLLPQSFSERKLAKILPEIYEKYGTGALSFSPIISYGANCALPHHDPGDARLQRGDSVILDIGGITNSYCSDMTRSLVCGTPSAEYREIYQIVLEANLTAIAAVKPGMRLKDVDGAARGVIERAGYGEYFTHRTGHGIGIEIHEHPDVSAVNEMRLQPGMAFSIEPGIYYKGKLGVRIEDLIIVTETGCEVLNRYPKELRCI
jgi:Xaa-Pro dipeptidase